MANWFQKAGRLLNPFDQHTLASSRNASGGLLDRYRWQRPSQNALVSDANIYNPETGAMTDRNTVSNYVGNNPQAVFPHNGKIYAGDPATYGLSPTGQPLPAPQTAPGSTGGSGGGGGGSAATEADILDVPIWDYEGNVFQNYTDWLAAIDAGVEKEFLNSLGQLNKGRDKAREDTGRTKSRLLEQVVNLLAEVTKSEKKGQQDIESYYGGLGDIYQSSQGVREKQFADEVTGERGRIDKEKTTNLEDIDRSLNEYLESTNTEESGLRQRADQLKDQQFSNAVQFRDQLAVNPTAQMRQYNPNIGAAQITDTSALRQQINQYISQGKSRNRYQATGSSPTYNYLNPV